MLRTYSELVKLPTFKERFDYLKLNGQVGEATFGWQRYLNQQFYKSSAWKEVRRRVILRDNGCDLGIPGHELGVRDVMVHHMNPITPEDMYNGDPKALDPENLITVSRATHSAITHGNQNELKEPFAVRKQGDTSPWR